MPQRFVVNLVCGHVNIFRHTSPRAGDTVYCLDCRDFQEVAGKQAARQTNWRAECTEQDCKFARHPSHEHAAIRAADTHSLRHAHRVGVYDRHNFLVKVITPEGIVTKT